MMKLSDEACHEDILPWQPFFGFLCMRCTLCHLVNTTEPSVCGSYVALCQMTLTTCSKLDYKFYKMKIVYLKP